MDNILLNSLVISSLLLLLYGAVRVSYSVWWKPKWLERRLNRQGIRGTRYWLPIGDLNEVGKQMTEAWSKPINLNHRIVSRVNPFIINHVQKYGKISLFWQGSTPRLTIQDPELMKAVFSNKLGHFIKPPILQNPQILILSRGLTTQEGETWAKHRRMMKPAFHVEKLKVMIPAFTKSCGKMIQHWEKMIGVQETCEVDVWPDLQRVTGDAIARAAFGSNYDQGKKIYELQNELAQLVLETMRTLYIPGFRFIPTKKNRRRKQLDKEITSLIKNLIQKKEAMMRTGESREDDLLGLLLHLTTRDSQSEVGSSTKCNGMTMEEVIEECKVFNIAGQETTASLLTWTMIALAMHPDWQEKAREEVLRVFSKNEPDFEALTHLKIVTMILYEVLRLYPPVISLTQHAFKETKIGELTIPAGVDIALPILLVHHDPELWGDDVEEFKPERFSDGISKASKDHVAFFPFGWGPRICIGQHFSMIEAKVALAMILQHFSFRLSPSYSHSPYTVLTLQPQHGAQIILHKL